MHKTDTEPDTKYWRWIREKTNDWSSFHRPDSGIWYDQPENYFQVNERNYKWLQSNDLYRRNVKKQKVFCLGARKEKLLEDSKNELTQSSILAYLLFNIYIPKINQHH